MGNIVKSTVSSQCSQGSTISVNTTTKKLGIFEEKENILPKSLFLKSGQLQDDVESLIMPIVLPQQSEYKQQDIYKVFVPTPRSDLGSDIEELWEKAVQDQSTHIIVQQQQLDDGTLYDGEWSKGKMHGVGRIYNENCCIYEGEFCMGLKSGQGMEIFSDIAYGRIIPINKIADRQYWKQYNGAFDNNKLDGDGVLELLNGSCVYGTFRRGQLDGMLTYECIINKTITKGCWINGQYQQ